MLLAAGGGTQGILFRAVVKGMGMTHGPFYRLSRVGFKARCTAFCVIIREAFPPGLTRLKHHTHCSSSTSTPRAYVPDDHRERRCLFSKENALSVRLVIGQRHFKARCFRLSQTAHPAFAKPPRAFIKSRSRGQGDRRVYANSRRRPLTVRFHHSQ